MLGSAVIRPNPVWFRLAGQRQGISRNRRISQLKSKPVQSGKWKLTNRGVPETIGACTGDFAGFTSGQAAGPLRNDQNYMKPLSFVFIRLAIGISMFGHGLVRIPKLNSFSEGMVGNFSQSYLPTQLVTPFSLVLPFLELFLGIALLLGWKTRIAGIGGALLMLLLMFGTSMIENWSALPSQMIHLLFFVLVHEFHQVNTFSLDASNPPAK
jgi:thiosulfate dehydrogenase [quinone] large subunit